MSVPRHGSDVTAAWLEEILSQYEAGGTPGVTVAVTSFTVVPATKPGENYGSEAVKIRAEGKVRRGKDDPQNATPITYHLFAKFLVGSTTDQEFMKLSKFHLRELLIYSDVIAELNDFQAKRANDKYRIDIPKFVYGICTDDEYVLVMEDISPAGYVMEDKVKGLDLPHALMAADRLARLHALSYAFSHTHNFLHKYPAFIDDYHFINTFYKSTADLLLEAVMEAAEKRGNEYEHLLTKLQANKKAILQRLGNTITNSENTKMACLAHGDFWTNNLMFLNDKDSQPQSMMFLDWGLTMWRNPVLDLHYYVYNSTTLNLRRNHLGDILRRYHSTFTAATTDLGVPVDGWDFEDFMMEWRRTRVFGTCIGLLNALMTLSKVAKTINNGTRPSTDSLSAKVGTWVARVMAPVMLSMFTSPWLEFFPRFAMGAAFKPMTQELVSWSNEQLQARIFDIMTEAYDDGVLDG